MRFLTHLGRAILLSCLSAYSYAATLTVTTDHDEANARTSNVGTDIYPLSTGCSLREAMQDIVIAALSSPGAMQPFPECGTASKGTSNTIVLAAHAIKVNATEKDPSDINGVGTINYGTLPNIADVASYGSLTVTGGAISCFSDSNAAPPIDGVVMFKFVGNSNATFSGVSFSSCTAPVGSGVAITNDGGGDLNLTGVTFTGIRATNEGNGGCITHGTGNLTITGGSFTGCVTDDGGAIPGGGHGNGGALYIGGVGDSTKVLIGGVTFQGNIAGDRGGAIYLSGTDAVAISMSAFQANIANGNTGTMTSQNPELGGGAIYAATVATHGNDDSDPLINASDFLILNSSFVGNLAPQGTGGAILLTGSNLTWGTLSVGDLSGPVLQVPGGIIASNFSGNVAGGTWATSPVDARAGSGGAVFADSGNVSILDSSFVLSNTSTSASGGAIAFIDPSENHTLAVSNTTFNNNSAALRGGAIANLNSFASTTGNGKITLVNDTIAGNSTATAGGGGGLFNANTFAPDVSISNTIFSDNTGENCNTGIAFTDGTGNLQFNPVTGCGSIANTNDPKLAAAAPFGGVNALVFVMKLNSGSGASDTGTESICAASPIFDLDAALNARPDGGPNCDVGAFESGNSADLSIAKSHTDPFVQGDPGDTYTITVSNVGSSATSGTVTVTDTLPVGLTAASIAGTGWVCVAPPTLSCARSDSLAAGSAYENITLTVSVAANAPTSVTNTASVSGGTDTSAGNDTASDPTNITAVTPDLTITKTHTDPFLLGSAGDVYTLTVSNAGNGATNGTVTVTDVLPSGLTATAIAGSGWVCAALPALSCTRNDALAPATSYPTLALTVSVAANAGSPLTNTATVAGGGETNAGNDTATDVTNIIGIPDLTVSKSHAGNFTPGQVGAVYTITPRNNGTAATTGLVTMTDTLPLGLTATSIIGTGWTCSATPVTGPGSLNCTRSDAMAAKTSYPDISLVVDVAANAPNPLVNTATVSGGGETDTTNDTATDQTTTPVTLQSFGVD
ncbi:MAG: choice-of-anchor Q domain-containing protein [Rudaea sp.]